MTEIRRKLGASMLALALALGTFAGGGCVDHSGDKNFPRGDADVDSTTEEDAPAGDAPSDTPATTDTAATDTATTDTATTDTRADGGTGGDAATDTGASDARDGGTGGDATDVSLPVDVRLDGTAG